MNLNELRIHGFRAFPPEEETFQFNGDNVVILGDNGTGKSSILAAFEFLLSGDLTHLSGEGTNDLNPGDHAPHQNASADECYVEGVFESSDGDTGTFRRSAHEPTNLESLSGDIEEDSINVSQWNDDHLILTRGQLLKFIEATARTRGRELSKLLNLNGITNRTRGFERVENHIWDREEEIESDCRAEVSTIASTLDIDVQFPLDTSDKDDIVEQTNSNLNLLQAGEISSLDDLESAMESIELEVAGEIQDTFYQSSVQNQTQTLLSELSEVEECNENIEELSELLEELSTIDTDSVKEVDLFETADRLVDSHTDICPLCGESHDEGYLQNRIQERIEHLSHIDDLRDDIDDLGEELRTQIRSYESSCLNLIEELQDGLEVGDHGEVEDNVNQLQYFIEELQVVKEGVSEPLIEHDDSGDLAITTLEKSEIDLDSDSVCSSLQSIHDHMDSLDERDKFTTAHAELVRVSDSWDSLRDQAPELDSVKELKEQLIEVNDLFSQSREESLADLYSSIEDNFNNYYTTIHPDEGEIDLSLDYDGTDSVEIEAQHGQERDSPLAYHSEGHIDTMGICLFLALREELDTSGPDIVLLDDIVMSIDKNHRRGVARLLSDYLDDGTQAILATHDEVWEAQLQRRGIVPTSNSIEITNWELSTGPMMNWGHWDLIQERIDAGDSNGAAAHLRRTAEKFGRNIAISLEARIPIQDDYTLGHYVNGINSKIKNVANETKRQRKQGTEIWKFAVEFDDKRAELWGDAPIQELNSMVHYNTDEWGQLSPGDLQEVLDRWKEIEEFLTCDDCQKWVTFSREGDHRWIHCEGRHIEFGYEN